MPTDEELAAHLGRVDLFSECDDFQLKLIAHRATRVSVPAGEAFIRAGGGGDELFLILDGSAEVRRDGMPVGTVRAGDHVGELAVLSPAPRSADVVALEPVQAAAISRDALQLVLHTTPTVADRLLSHLAARVRSVTPGTD